MTFSKISRGVCAAAALLLSVAVLGGARTAHAQAGAIKPPDTYNPIDGNGVNLLSGSMTATTPTILIGPKGGGLSYSQSYDSGSVTPWSDTTNGMVATSTLTNDAWYTVTMMGQTFPFKRTGDTFAAQEGNTATLVMGGGLFTLTLLDGTVATYSSAYPTYMLGVVNNLGSIVKIVYPNGRTIDFTYRVDTDVRLQSVNSSDGYQLHFDYASNSWGGQGSAWYQIAKVTALNRAYDACDPSALTCSYSRTWPSLTFGYAANERSVTDALGRTTHYLFNGLLSGIRRPGRASGQDVLVYYNGETQIVEQVTTDTGNYVYAIPDGYKYGYPSNPNQVIINSATQVTDPLGHTRVVTNRSTLVDLATHHRVTRLYSVSNGVDYATLYGYTNFRLSSIQRATEYNGTSYGFDARGNITSVSRSPKLNSGASPLVVTATYPANCDASNFRICNQPATVTDARGAVTAYTYDPAHGGVLTVTSPAPTSGAIQPQVRTSYAPFYAWYKNAAGAIVQDARPTYLPVATSVCATLGPATATAPAPCVNTADEVRTTTTYEAGSASLGSNLLALATSSGDGAGTLTATTTVTYSYRGDVRTVDGPLPGGADITRTAYDDGRQPVMVIGPDPDGAGALLYRATRTTYNLDGQVTNVETGTTTGQSDADLATFVALQAVQTTYDLPGRKAFESLVVSGVAQTLTQYGYDADSRLTCQAVRMNPTATPPASACTPTLGGADGDDRVTYTEYDGVDRVTRITTGYGTSQPRVEKVVTYTLQGKEGTVADGKGNLTTYEYDAFDRLAKARYPNTTCCASSTTDFDAYGYDANDNRTSWLHRPSVVGQAGQTTSYTFDALNRMTYRDGPKGWYYFDNLGRPTYTYSGDAAEKIIAHYYDGLGRPSYTYDYRDGTWFPTYTGYDLAGRRTTLQWSDGNYVNYDYDVAGEVVGIRENNAVYLATFGYDNLGRRTYLSRGNGVVSWYGYDAASRLNSLNLDLASTSQDQTWTLVYNAANQIKSRTSYNSAYLWAPGAASSLSYTINGLNQATTAGGTALAYDGRGNLISGGATGFAYDLDNRLTGASGSISATLSYDPLGRLGQTTGGAVTRFVYSGPDLIAELNTSNAVLRRYVPGPGTDEPLVWYEGSGMSDRRWLLADERSSIVAATNASGAAININTYDEYGVPGINTGRFQYTGQIWLPEVGLYHYKARAYSPTLGRFLQTDPIGYSDGLNWYAYVGNDPLNRSDALGLNAKTPDRTQSLGPCESDFDLPGTCSVLVDNGERGPPKSDESNQSTQTGDASQIEGEDEDEVTEVAENNYVLPPCVRADIQCRASRAWTGIPRNENSSPPGGRPTNCAQAKMACDALEAVHREDPIWHMGTVYFPDGSQVFFRPGGLPTDVWIQPLPKPMRTPKLGVR
ncbi:RHS repeat domain-containing protein [Caulobacter sp. UNC358MFTsu5.1]|uniref:RHS repeat domain-containing protein n=1 Tax=Caulobacter sp. UNC358MFTsu5.1 TaxID=1449049 RepID=UPI0012DEDC71|nr:RHS repeat-associated core domain-containing protein [Caulobacter sp. UNC358MFTsu5.1]